MNHGELEGWDALIAQSQELGVESAVQPLRVGEGRSPEENQGTVSRRGIYAEQAEITYVGGPALSLLL